MKLIIQSILQTLLWTILLGVMYPLVMTVIAQVAFPYQANGSLLKDDKGNIVGSELIAQQFTGTKYFWPRPSAAANAPQIAAYGTMPSAGSNLGPTSSALQTNVQANAKAMRDAHAKWMKDPVNDPIPSDLVFTSASGVDPHITPEAARFQIGRVADARGLKAEDVSALVDQFVEGPQFGFLGEARVNVLKLNLALDAKWPATKPAITPPPASLAAPAPAAAAPAASAPAASGTAPAATTAPATTTN
jgi:potassium-transporting ATPase KdpC subunit